MRMKKDKAEFDKLYKEASGDDSVLTKWQEKAVKAGFVKDEQKPDTVRYAKSMREQSARNFTDETGAHPFVNDKGEVDVSKYRRHLREQNKEKKARSALLKSAEG